MFADYHVHTSFSDDSEYDMEQVVRDAIDMGMQEICFTDHVDYGIKRDWDDPEGVIYRAGGPGEPDQIPLANVDYPAYTEKLFSLKEKYRNKIAVKLGLEFGMQRHTIAAYGKLYARYPFDFIILSVHEVEDREFWNGEFQKGKTRDECYRSYYEEMLYLVEHFGHYSVLGHMDLISRYDPEGEYPFEKTEPWIRRILQRVIADGKGIEVNTSCYRYGLADLTPGIRILELYRDLGGTVLTIGSDSHKPEHLGEYIPETMAQLRSMGFTQICTFDRMEAVGHALSDKN